MMNNRFTRTFVLAGCTFVGGSTMQAQGMDHSKMAGMDKAAAGVPSQAAFATIQDIVRKLRADPTTDWSKVNLEALRQHLIDMDDVVMRSAVSQSKVAGGVSLEITGEGKVVDAIKRVATMHAMALNEEGIWVVRSSEVQNGVWMVVTAKNPSDEKAVAQLRGLGFVGLLTEGDHHAMHHMMLAKGEEMMHERKP